MSEQSVASPKQEEDSPPQEQPPTVTPPPPVVPPSSPSRHEQLKKDVDPMTFSDSISVSSEDEDIVSYSSKATSTERSSNSSDEDEDDDTQEKEKKIKYTVLGGTVDKKNIKECQEKTFLERLSSDIETEITLLNCMLAFRSELKKYPFSDSAEFYDFYNNWFIVDTPASLLVEAIKGLKKKHQKMAIKIAKNLCPLGPRDLEAFELAKQIWNDIGISSETDQSVNEEKFNEDCFFLSMYPYLKESLKLMSSISSDSIVNGLGLIGCSKMQELDEQWKKFWNEQMQLTLKQNELDSKREDLSSNKQELISEQERLFIDAIGSSSSPKSPTDPITVFDDFFF